MSEKYYWRAEGVSCRLVLNEAVIVRPGQGDMAVLNESGSLVWFAADGRRTGSDLAGVIRDAYGLEQEPDITAFLAELVEAGLLVAGEQACPRDDTCMEQPRATRFESPACKAREPLEALAATCGSAWTVAGSCNPQAFGACVDPWD